MIHLNVEIKQMCIRVEKKINNFTIIVKLFILWTKYCKIAIIDLIIKEKGVTYGV